MPMVALRPLDEVDLVAGGQGHHGLLPVGPAPGEAAHALELALVGRRADGGHLDVEHRLEDRKSTRLNSSHLVISYAVFCLKKKKKMTLFHSLQIHRSRYP